MDNLIIKLGTRIDTTNYLEVEKDLLNQIAATPHTSLTLDADDLDYIASSGLRVVLKLAKMDKTLRIINTDLKVYNIFEMTGFAKIINIEKKLRKIDLSQCKLLGAGGTGAVYRVTPEEIVKVNYNPATDAEMIEEKEKSQAAFVLGVPTAISFDTVDCGEGRKGVVYETIKSTTLGEMLEADPSQCESLVNAYIKALRTINSIHTDNPIFPSAIDFYIDCIEKAKPFYTEEEMAMLQRVVDAMPQGDCLVHGDAHPKNLMLQGDEMMWIDMAMVCVGRPIYDIISLACMLFLSNDDYAKKLTGMSLSNLQRFAETFIRLYFGVEDEAEVLRYKMMMAQLYMIRGVFSIGFTSPSTIKARPKILQMAHERFFPNIDSIIATVEELGAIE